MEYDDLRVKDSLNASKDYRKRLAQAQKRRRQERQMLADIEGIVQDLHDKEIG